MERKLASVVKIVDIQPIVGADAIVVASVKGWKVVVKKDEYNATPSANAEKIASERATSTLAL